MSWLFLRFLVAVCSILLVLPPGWCCYVLPAGCCGTPTQQSAEEEPASTPVKPACGCCHPKESSPTDSEETGTTADANQPTPAPEPVPLNCDCLQRDSIKPTMSADIDLDLVIIGPVADEVAPALRAPLALSPRGVLLTPSLQVLLCVWRC